MGFFNAATLSIILLTSSTLSASESISSESSINKIREEVDQYILESGSHLSEEVKTNLLKPSELMLRNNSKDPISLDKLDTKAIVLGVERQKESLTASRQKSIINCYKTTSLDGSVEQKEIVCIESTMINDFPFVTTKTITISQ